MQDLPQPLPEYYGAANARNSEAFSSCFSTDAIVRDEGHVRQGREEILKWFKETGDRYNPSYVVKRCVTTKEGADVTATVSGTFPGSPLDLTYRFTLQDNKIRKLEIGI